MSSTRPGARPADGGGAPPTDAAIPKDVAPHPLSALAQRRRAGAAALAFLAAIGAALVALPLPSVCPLRRLAGIPCPTCGFTRALRLLLEGDLGGATRIYPAWVLVGPALAAFLVLEFRGVARKGQFGDGAACPALRRVWPVVVAVVLAIWIARFFGAFGGPAPV